jgi:hypothetical protein
MPMKGRLIVITGLMVLTAGLVLAGTLEDKVEEAALNEGFSPEETREIVPAVVESLQEGDIDEGTINLGDGQNLEEGINEAGTANQEGIDEQGENELNADIEEAQEDARDSMQDEGVNEQGGDQAGDGSGENQENN